MLQYQHRLLLHLVMDLLQGLGVAHVADPDVTPLQTLDAIPAPVTVPVAVMTADTPDVDRYNQPHVTNND